MRGMLKQFLTKELMIWNRMRELYGAELSALPPFAPAAGQSQMLWEAFQQRVTEHVRLRFTFRPPSLTRSRRTFEWWLATTLTFAWSGSLSCCR